MRRLPFYLLALAAAACADSPAEITGPATSTDLRPSRGATSSSQVPVFRPGVVVARFYNDARGLQTAARHGATPIRALRGGARVLRVPEGREQAVVQALNADAGVVFAELSVPRTLGLPCTAGDGDCQPPTDALFGLRWDLHNDGALRDEFGNVIWNSGLVPDSDSDWLEAFDQLGYFAGTARLGVIDTGIFGGHADLAGRLVAQYDFFNADPIAEDDNGHGTHVSGIALAHGDDGVGTPGVAYGPDIELVVAKGCGLLVFSYVCWSDDIADGIVWAVDNGANVINLSLGGDSGSQVEQEALQYALANDVLPVCAAGNDKAAVDFPGAFPECMAVSATDWADELSSYSSFGPQVEVAAPGGDTILANGYDRILSSWNNGGYVFAAGTSMASPHVAGLATLLHALGVTSAEDKRQIIRSTADDLGAAGFDVQFGDGRVNVWNAVLAALGGPPPPPPPNELPMASFTSACTDNACDFTDVSTDPDGIITQWSWDFGDGAVSSAQSPSHAYAAAGDYTVVLTVTDNRGATDTAQQNVSATV
ncbi:MAG: S8 family serine peptidase [Gemmatimonadota bacterium]|nr:S8 family serine peptidase [Gemmatimonadota bacterium]